MKRKYISGSEMSAETEVIKKTAIAPQNDCQFNACVTGPYAAKRQSLSRSNSNLSKKNLQQWLRLQEVHHRLKDCEDEEERMDLYISKNHFTIKVC